MPVDRDTPALLPVNMLDWVPEDHVVRLVIDTVEAVATPELTARLVPAVRSRRGRRRYDPVMMLTLLAYSYLRGVLSSRAIEDRCRYDVTFRVACGKLVPDHVTIARFRKLACSQDGLMEELFYAVLRVCAAAGLGRLTAVAAMGSRSARTRRRRRTGPRPGCGSWPRRYWPGPRPVMSRARRARGQAWLDARAAGQPVTKPPACAAVDAARIGLEQEVARHQALAGEWDRKRAAGGRAQSRSRPGRPPGGPAAGAAGPGRGRSRRAAGGEGGGSGGVSRTGRGRRRTSPGRCGTSPTRTRR